MTRAERMRDGREHKPKSRNKSVEIIVITLGTIFGWAKWVCVKPMAGRTSEKGIGKESEICAMERNVTADARFRDLYATCSCSFAVTSHLGNSSSSSSSIGSHRQHAVAHNNFYADSLLWATLWDLLGHFWSCRRSFVCLFRVLLLFYNPTHCSMF